MRIIHAAVLVLTAAHVACSATDPNTSGGLSAAPVAKTTSTLIASAPGSPASTLGAGGTYWFVFDESSVAQTVASECAETEKTPSAVQACVDGVRNEGANEGIRFSSPTPDQLTWTSFGVRGGQEEVFLEVPLAVAWTAGTLVQTRATGPAHGTQVQSGHKGPSDITFDVIDAHTVAMVDPGKGRLVFRTRS
jgi:hypothetical protein